SSRACTRPASWERSLAYSWVNRAISLMCAICHYSFVFSASAAVGGVLDTNDYRGHVVHLTCSVGSARAARATECGAAAPPAAGSRYRSASYLDPPREVGRQAALGVAGVMQRLDHRAVALRQMGDGRLQPGGFSIEPCLHRTLGWQQRHVLQRGALAGFGGGQILQQADAVVAQAQRHVALGVVLDVLVGVDVIAHDSPPRSRHAALMSSQLMLSRSAPAANMLARRSTLVRPRRPPGRAAISCRVRRQACTSTPQASMIASTSSRVARVRRTRLPMRLNSLSR